jgi:hypothetical protein
MIPLFPIDEVCPFCRKACLDSFGEHAVHCKELPGFKYRHDFVRDVLYDIFRRAGVSVKKEAPVNFLADPQEGRSTCFYNQHAFITFAFYTFGFLAPEVVDLLNRVQKVMHSNIVSHKSMDVVFKRMSFAIQKSGCGSLLPDYLLFICN